MEEENAEQWSTAENIVLLTLWGEESVQDKIKRLIQKQIYFQGYFSYNGGAGRHRFLAGCDSYVNSYVHPMCASMFLRHCYFYILSWECLGKETMQLYHYPCFSIITLCCGKGPNTEVDLQMLFLIKDRILLNIKTKQHDKME